jgi:hypothetical protein
MRSGHGPTLAERTAASRGGADRERAPGGARHCWVVDAPGHPGRYPGLLLAWRRGSDGWSGLVSYSIDEPGNTDVRLVQRWVPAACLSPVDTEPG